MWQEYIRLREDYLKQAESQNEAYREYLRDHFLFRIFQLAGHSLSEERFQEIIHTDKRPKEEEDLRAYDLGQAWKFTQEKAEEHTPFSPELIQCIAQKVMKHTGAETTTTIGRYNTSLGEFRLGEDYNAVYPIADYYKIPDLLTSLCRTTQVQLQETGVVNLIKTAIHFLFEYAHIKPFGAGNIETGMLSTNYLLLYHHQLLLVIYPEDRPHLLSTLKTHNLQQTPEEFENFILQEQIKFLREEIDYSRDKKV